MNHPPLDPHDSSNIIHGPCGEGYPCPECGAPTDGRHRLCDPCSEKVHAKALETFPMSPIAAIETRLHAEATEAMLAERAAAICKFCGGMMSRAPNNFDVGICSICGRSECEDDDA